MVDRRIALWAETLVEYSLEVRPGQQVAITGGVAAAPLLNALYRAVLAKGACPTLIPSLPGTLADLLALGGDEQLEYLSPVDRFAREHADALVNVLAETNTRALSAIDPARQRVLQKGRAPLLEAMMRRTADGSFRWVLTLFPTDAYAMDADLSTDAFAEFVMDACKLDEADPAAAWKAQSADQARLSFPIVTQGREVHDIRLRFEAGRVVDASAARNEPFLLDTLDTDEGARRLGEFAFGTNFGIQRCSKNILFDEKIGGTVHMAVGAGYPDTGSGNVSAVHWDMICDLRRGGEVDIDGQPFLRDGRFVV